MISKSSLKNVFLSNIQLVSFSGLEEVESECHKLQIEFHLLKGESQICVPDLVNKLKLDAVVSDFSPLRVPLSWIDSVKKNIPKDVPFCQVILGTIIIFHHSFLFYFNAD